MVFGINMTEEAEVLFEDILGKDLWKIYCESKHSAQKEFDEIKEWVKSSYSSNK